MNVKNKAFSLAEMMMVLLILSIVVAASTPIITKRSPGSSQGSGSSSPVGSVIIWPTDNLPQGDDRGKWIECNGQSTENYPELERIVGDYVPDYRNVVLQGADTAGVRTKVKMPGNDVTAASPELQNTIKAYNNSPLAKKTGTFDSMMKAFFPSSASNDNNDQSGTDYSTQQDNPNEGQTVSISVKYLIKARS